MKIIPFIQTIRCHGLRPYLRMAAKYYGRSISLDYLRNKSQYGKEGVSMLGLADAAESLIIKKL